MKAVTLTLALALTVVGSAQPTSAAQSAMVTTSAPTIPTVKGLKPGITFSEFTYKVISGPAVSNCVNGVYHEVQDRLMHASSDEVTHIDFMADLNCQSYQKMVAANYTGLISCGEGDSHFCTYLNGNAVFHAGKLDSLLLHNEGAFTDVLADSVTKFGQPTDTGTDALQNGFGATWQVRRATWRTSSYVFEMQEHVGDAQNRYIIMVYQTPEFYASEHKHVHGSLD
jgi:hypothetical protein